MLSIRIIRRQDQSSAVKITSAEQEVFKWCVATLKQMIPQPLRRFDFAARYWVIAQEAAEHLEAYGLRIQAAYCADVERAVETEVEREARERKEQERRQSSQDEQTTYGEGGRRGQRNGLRLARCMDLESAFEVLYLRPGAPPEVIQAVYRTLAKMHHPDVGGSTDVMAEINDAYGFMMNALKDESAA